MEDVTVLILAGGDSSRLWPLTNKHTLTFLSKPLIWYSLSQLVRNGMERVIIVVSRGNKQQIQQVANEFSSLSVKLVEQHDPRGMAGATLSGAGEIADTRLLILGPSDIYEDILWSGFKKLLHDDPPGIIAGTTVETYFPGGYLTIVNNEVKGIVEKPDPKEVPSQFVTFGFYYFRSSSHFLSTLNEQKGQEDDLFEKALEVYFKGNRIQFLPYKGYWGYVKYPWHVLTLTGHFLGKIKGKTIKKAVVAQTATISGDVYIEDGVRVLDHASIVGPTYIGRGSVVGNNALVRESMIGGHSVVGFSTEIVRSWVGEGCWFHSNYIGDSVISDNVAFGAGAMTANFRLDEGIVYSTILGKKIESGRVKLGSVIGENVRIGVNASIMPGVKIGKNTSVSAGICITRDIDDDSFCIPKVGNYKVLKNKRPVEKSSVRATVLNNLTKK